MIDGIQSASVLSFTRGVDGVTSKSASAMSEGTAESQAVGESFQTTLAGMARDMAGDLKAAEAASFAGITGQAETREVVDAVMTAEQTLQTAIAIRDKIVTAYLEISRMQI